MSTHDFVVVANRLPVDVVDGHWQVSPGGLVTALQPVLKNRGGCWVGWPGTTEEDLEPFDHDGFRLQPVSLSQQEFEDYYEGFSNATLWPLYHDLVVQPQYHRHWFEAYLTVNHRFAQATAAVAAPGATVWVQDYQLQLVPGLLRKLRPDLKIGFFLHIPFPHPDLFHQLPWRKECVEGIVGADVVGFHLRGNAENFLQLTDSPQGQASIREITATCTAPDGRTVGVGAFPISIDTSAVVHEEDEVARVRTALAGDTVILGVDRLDYTKGILHRLEAFEELLEEGKLDPDNTVLVQVATPSRERIDDYKRTRQEVEAAVGRINGRFGRIAKPVVHYIHRSLPKAELMAYYVAADVMLVTPLKDGMNLVAKEFVACHPDSGALVLSEFAGAADELKGAYLCNPFDVESIKKKLVQAVEDVRADKTGDTAAAMYSFVQEHNVDLWASSFLRALDQAQDKQWRVRPAEDGAQQGGTGR